MNYFICNIFEIIYVYDSFAHIHSDTYVKEFLIIIIKIII